MKKEIKDLNTTQIRKIKARKRIKGTLIVLNGALIIYLIAVIIDLISRWLGK